MHQLVKADTQLVVLKLLRLTMDCSDDFDDNASNSYKQNNTDKDHELDETYETDEYYELILTKGNALGKVIIIKTSVDELVHGRT